MKAGAGSTIHSRCVVLLTPQLVFNAEMGARSKWRNWHLVGITWRLAVAQAGSILEEREPLATYQASDKDGGSSCAQLAHDMRLWWLRPNPESARVAVAILAW